MKRTLSKKVTQTEYKYVEDYSYNDLGSYCLLFKTACQMLATAKLKTYEYAIILFALGNMRDDGQVYIHVPTVATSVGCCQQTAYSAIKVLVEKNILMPMRPWEGSKYYQVGLTHMVNQRLAFQGKLTSDRAKSIANDMPLLCIHMEDGSVDEFDA